MISPSRSLTVIVTLSLIVIACHPAVHQENRQFSSNGSDSPSLESLYKDAGKLEFLRSLLVWRDSALVAEQYFQSYSGDSLDHVRSVTKSIMSILTGIAVDKGLIETVDDPVNKYLSMKLGGYSLEKQEITIEQLLTMSGGFEWNEDNVAEFNSWSSSKDPLDHVFRRKLVDEPGSTFNYNSALPHVLSIIISDASGMSTKEFAEQHLFEPLGIKQIRWRKLSDGHYSGGAGLEITPADLMKIGVMMLNDGMYEGKEIVSSQWVNTSSSKHLTVQEIPGVATIGYGYLWWTANFDGAELYQAKGYGGQYLVVVPESKTVVAITSQWRNLGGNRLKYLNELDGVLARGSNELIGFQIPEPPGN